MHKSIEEVREYNRLHMRMWRQKNREKCLEAGRRYYRNNREKSLESARRWREKNKEYRSACESKRWADNKDAIKEKCRKYRIENRASLLKSGAEYRNKNRERRRELYKAWAKANKDVVKMHKRQGEKKIRQATAAWADRNKIKHIYTKAIRSGMTVDHVIPLSHKLVCGIHVEGNLQILTHYANSAKNNRFIPQRLVPMPDGTLTHVMMPLAGYA